MCLTHSCPTRLSSAFAYNVSMVVDFNGPLDTYALQAALHDVCRSHDALRTTFPEDGATQIVHHDLAPQVRSLAWQGDAAAFGRWLDDAVLKPIKLDQGPMLGAWILTDRKSVV